MQSEKHEHHPYRTLALALLISYISMVVMMFSRVNIFENVHLSLNQIYMAGLMVFPMMIIMLTTMGHMYPNKKRSSMLIGIAAFGIAGAWFLLRNQVGVGDRQFLNSMIPHHAAAITVCEQADLKDPEVQDLCRRIITAQKKEIEEMNALLAR